MRVLLDTNLLVSYLLLPRDPFQSIVQAALVGAFSLLMPELLLDELAATLAKTESMGIRFSSGQSAKFFEDLKLVAVKIPDLADEIRSVTGDLKVDYLIAWAVRGEAEIVVSADRNLLLLGGAGNLSFIHPADFLRLLSICS